jgi:hypothetical protein
MLLAMRLKREGVLAGASDIVVPWPTQGVHGMFVELKQPGNTPTSEQQDFLLEMIERGYRAYWVDTWFDALHLFCAHFGKDTKWIRL